ncbi:MAG: RluA family pseudouridine synthase [Clostridiaceae bacterium]|nr:RluA family pseudouridine synthase [Clostridiaceae bacterium]
MEFKYIVEEKYNNLKINEILKSRFDFSKLMLKRIRLYGELLLNSKSARMIDTAKTHDKIIVRTPNYDPETSFFRVNRLKDVPIIFEDDHIVVLNKPANLVVHPTYTHPDGTLLDLLSSNKLHAATRLDRETSGIMVLAKHSHAHYRLMKFPMERIYIAINHGIWQQKSGEISAPIKRAENSIMIRVVDNGGKTAVTNYRVLFENFKENFSLTEFKLITGRTHQIRVHSLFMGKPILADGLYGIADYFPNLSSGKNVPCIQKDICRVSLKVRLQFLELLNDLQLELDTKLDRQALHSKKLGFIHPITEQHMEFETPIPEDFKKILG